MPQTISLRDRLAGFAEDVRKEAERLPPGEDRNDLLAKARQADTASDLHDWLASPGLQPPK